MNIIISNDHAGTELKKSLVEYLEKELNELMAQKKKNDETSKEQFKNRVKDSKKKAIEENIAKATKEGNKLMQTINEEGELVNADHMDVPGKGCSWGPIEISIGRAVP